MCCIRQRRAFDEQEVTFSGFSMNFWLYYFMYFALSVVTGFQRDNGCGAAGSGERGGGVDQKSERLRKKY